MKYNVIIRRGKVISSNNVSNRTDTFGNRTDHLKNFTLSLVDIIALNDYIWVLYVCV